MNKLQQKAIDDFNKFGYLIVNAPRRSGKTTLLREIIRQNICEGLYVKCLNKGMFDALYGDIKGIKYMMGDVIPKDARLVIGDEVFFDPKSKVTRIACALTPRYYIHKWPSSSVQAGKEQVKELKKQMSPEQYRCEIG